MGVIKYQIHLWVATQSSLKTNFLGILDSYAYGHKALHYLISTKFGEEPIKITAQVHGSSSEGLLTVNREL